MLETQVQHRKNELQAAQSRLDNLPKEIEKKTAELLKVQAKKLADSHVKLKATITELESRTETQKDTITANANSITQLKNEIDTKKTALAGVETATKEASDKLIEILTKVEQTNGAIRTQESRKHSLETENSFLETTKHTLEESITELQDKIVALEVQISFLDTIYDEKVTAKENSIAKLDAKILKSTQDVETVLKEQDLIRNDFALWQKGLDERDRNLRLREMKVQQGEEKIVSNSALLNI